MSDQTAPPMNIDIAKIYTEWARIRIAENLRALERPEDREVSALADAVVAEGRYRWDLI